MPIDALSSTGVRPAAAADSGSPLSGLSQLLKAVIRSRPDGFGLQLDPSIHRLAPAARDAVLQQKLSGLPGDKLLELHEKLKLPVGSRAAAESDARQFQALQRQVGGADSFEPAPARQTAKSAAAADKAADTKEAAPKETEKQKEARAKVRQMIRDNFRREIVREIMESNQKALAELKKIGGG